MQTDNLQFCSKHHTCNLSDSDSLFNARFFNFAAPGGSIAPRQINAITDISSSVSLERNVVEPSGGIFARPATRAKFVLQ